MTTMLKMSCDPNFLVFEQTLTFFYIFELKIVHKSSLSTYVHHMTQLVHTYVIPSYEVNLSQSLR